jgi:hypothetical protein
MGLVIKTFTRTLAIIAVAMFAFTGSAKAAVIDFESGGAFGGTVTTDGIYWYGTGIPLNLVTVTGTAADGIYDLSGTGDSSTGLGANCCAALSFNTQANTISIVGGIPSLGIADGTTLLWGSFNLGTFTASGTSFGFQLSGQGTDQKSPLLLTALGLPTNTQFAYLAFDQGLTSTAPGSYYSTSADITNVSIPVPEPGLLALFGLGLLGVGRKLARRGV